MTATVQCAKPGCGERAHFEYDSQRERAESEKFRKGHPWRCYRHTNEDEVLSPGNPERATVLTAVTVEHSGRALPGLSWRAEGETSGSGFVSGPGFKAIASDLPSGTRLIVTARIELPEADLAHSLAAAAGGETRTEWAVRWPGIDLDPAKLHPERGPDAEQHARGVIARNRGTQIYRRTVTDWPDGSTLIGAWIEVQS
ncbi:hypothetical protein [Micromonospora chersina]